MNDMVKKEVAKMYSCLKCGAPFVAYPPDDRHDTASRIEKEFEDPIRVDYKCKDCPYINTIYWGHPKMTFAFG
jgi:DNA-directed RNA polymerase subunit RPC12/RpoP